MARRTPKYSLTELEALRDKAGRESLARIREDLRTASWKLQPHLESILDRLFDPGLDAGEILASPGAGTGLTVDFHRDLGESIGDYIDKERVATGTRLLGLAADLSLDEAAFLLGFSDRSVLSNAFERHTGLRPTAFRRKWAEAVALAGRPKIEVHSLRLLKELREGRLSPVEARKLLDFFEGLERSREDGSPYETQKPTTSARELAEQAWERIAQRDAGEQLLWVRDVLRFNRSAFFHLLGEKVEAELEEVSEETLARAYWWTLLAIVHVEANAEEIGEDATRSLRPLALNWLGDVRWRDEVREVSVLSERSLLRLRRLEGRLLQGVGRLAEAEEVFRETRLAFLRRHWGEDAALTSLNLAILLSGHAGKISEIQALASQAVPVLQGRPDRDDARATLRGLSDALRREDLTSEVLEAARVCLARLCPCLLEPA